jgi:hypothetical protein
MEHREDLALSAKLKALSDCPEQKPFNPRFSHSAGAYFVSAALFVAVASVCSPSAISKD